MEILEGDTTYAPSSIFIIHHIILSLTSFMLNTSSLTCISCVGSGNQLSSSLTHYVVPDCQVCDTW